MHSSWSISGFYRSLDISSYEKKNNRETNLFLHKPPTRTLQLLTSLVNNKYFLISCVGFLQFKTFQCSQKININQVTIIKCVLHSSLILKIKILVMMSWKINSAESRKPVNLQMKLSQTIRRKSWLSKAHFHTRRMALQLAWKIMERLQTQKRHLKWPRYPTLHHFENLHCFQATLYSNQRHSQGQAILQLTSSTKENFPSSLSTNRLEPSERRRVGWRREESDKAI